MRCDDLAGFGKDTQSVETCGPFSVFCYKLHLAGALRLLSRWKKRDEIVLNLISDLSVVVVLVLLP